MDRDASADGQSVGACHAYCHDCDWYATPPDYEYADVLTAAEAHSTFTGHKTTAGLGDETATEAMARAD